LQYYIHSNGKAFWQLLVINVMAWASIVKQVNGEKLAVFTSIVAFILHKVALYWQDIYIFFSV